jgi:hypothetical protein
VSEEQARQRRQQRIEELCAASIRALAGEPDLHFRGGRLYRGERRLPAFAPHLQPSIERDPFSAFRGAADGLALRVRHSDATLHAAHTPPTPPPRPCSACSSRSASSPWPMPRCPACGTTCCSASTAGRRPSTTAA